ncbi:MAG TPA: thiamine pyrophosphate-dependent enzyme, partial [Steroidobacteraceae bacterium]
FGIGVITIVFNNNAFGNVRRDQQTLFDGRLVGADLINPDFMKLAEAFSVARFRASTPAQLRTALEQAMTATGPSLIEVPVERGSEVSPWKFLQPAPP